MWLVGCPNPNKMDQSWEYISLISLSLYPYKDKIRMKKNHHWTSKLLANMHSWSGPSSGRACRLVVLKSIDEIFFDTHFVFICLKSFKNCTPNFVPMFHFGRVRAAFQKNVCSFHPKWRTLKGLLAYTLDSQINAPARQIEEKNNYTPSNKHTT